MSDGAVDFCGLTGYNLGELAKVLIMGPIATRAFHV